MNISAGLDKMKVDVEGWEFTLRLEAEGITN
jgi:hypothetical protein